MPALAEYGLFLAKAITIVIAVIVVLTTIAALASKGKEKAKERLQIKKLNDKYKDFAKLLNQEILAKQELKSWLKSEKKTAKEKEEQSRKKIFVLNFIGDMRASAVKALREEITAILTIAKPQDEVVIRLESPGGLVHAYGLAASQLQRLKQHHIPLTVAVDKVAASGGYLMACIANRIIAAPFAIIGSIGVVAQLPNFNRLLKKHDIDFEQFTAGEFKRTVTLFGENTDKGREKFQAEIQDAHLLFKNFINEHRPQVNVDKIATGEHWFGARAIELKLIDQISTSDDYLLNASQQADIFEISMSGKKGLLGKFALQTQTIYDNIANLAWRRNLNIY